MSQIQQIIALVSTSVSLLITTLTFLLKYVKSVKAKRLADQAIKICNAIVPYIEQAESFTQYSGIEKKEFVMTKANQYAIENGITFNASLVSQKIEELVKLSKEVNKREKKQENSAPTYLY